MEIAENPLAQRLREARDRIGMTQKQLAEAAGFTSHQIVSQIEKGDRDVKAWELARLANALSMNLQDLLSAKPITHSFVLWREPPQQDAGAKEVVFLERFRRFCFVERVTNSAPQVQMPRPRRPIEQMSYRDAAALADNVRAVLGLGERPAFALLDAAESQLGVQTWYADLEHDGSAAAHVEAQGAGVLLSSVEPPWRRNFSFAHELFHVLTWEPENSSKIAAIKADQSLFDHNERLANAFASALLLPAEPIREELRKGRMGEGLTYAALVSIAGDFGVSTQALLWRLVNMGMCRRDQVSALLVDPELSALDAATRKGTWWDPPPLPPRFVRLSYLAWQQGHLSRSRLAQYLETPLAELEMILAQYGMSEQDPDQDIDFSAIAVADCFSLEEEEWPVDVPSA